MSVLFFLTLSLYIYFNNEIITFISVLILSFLFTVFFVKRIGIKSYIYKLFKIKVTEEHIPAGVSLRYEIIPERLNFKEFIKPFLFLLFFVLFVIDIIFLSGYICDKRLRAYKNYLNSESMPVSIKDFKLEVSGNKILYNSLKGYLTDIEPEFRFSLIDLLESNKKWDNKITSEFARISKEYETFLNKKIYPSIKECDYYWGRDYEPQQIGEVINLGKVIIFTALDKFTTGNYNEGWRHLEMALKLSRIISNDISFISKMSSVTFNKLIILSITNIEKNCSQIIIPENIKNELQGILKNDLAKKALKNQLAFILDELKNFKNQSENFAFCSDYLTAGQSSLTEQIFTCMLEKFMAISGQIDLEGLKSSKSFYELIQDKKTSQQIIKEYEKLPIWPFVLNKTAIPNYAPYIDRENEVKILSKLALICDLLNIYHKKTGKYPKNLAELNLKTGDILISELDKEFSYKVYDKGFEICSLWTHQDIKPKADKLCVRK